MDSDGPDSKPFGDYTVTEGDVTREVVVEDHLGEVHDRSHPSKTSRPRPTRATSGSADSGSDVTPIKEETSSWAEALPSHNGGAGHGDTGRGRRRRYERPNWTRLVVFLVIAGCTWPWMILFAFLARKTPSLDWARAVVGIGTWVASALLSAALLDMARLHFESLSWATYLMYGRNAAKTSGAKRPMKFSDLERCSNTSSRMKSAINISFLRLKYWFNGARSKDDSFSWYWTSFFFISVTLLASCLNFLLNRTLIFTSIPGFLDSFVETKAYADLNATDIQNAVDKSPLVSSTGIDAWSLSSFFPYSTPPSWDSTVYNEEIIYFSQTTWDQFRVDRYVGAFDEFSSELKAEDATSNFPSNDVVSLQDTILSDDQGGIIEFPKWGLRMSCIELPNAGNFLIPEVRLTSSSNATVVFVTADMIQEPISTLKLDLTTFSLAPMNASGIFANVTLPEDLDVSEAVFGGVFPEDGQSMRISSTFIADGSNGNGWITLDIVLVRVNSSFAPEGKFPVNGTVVGSRGSVVEYDAALCVAAIEPYIVSHSIGPTGIKIVSVADKTGTMEDENVIEELLNGPPDRALKRKGGSNGADRQLNSTGKLVPFRLAWDNSVYELEKGNGRGTDYFPSSTLVFATDGSTPTGYTSLEMDFLEAIRGKAIAASTLPYMTGQHQIVSRLTKEKLLPDVEIDAIGLGVFVGVVIVLGLLAELTVPRLPGDHPRRGFDLYSWLAVLQDDELELPTEWKAHGREVTLTQIERALGDIPIGFLDS